MKRLLIMVALCAFGQLGCGSEGDDASSNNDDSCSASDPCTSGTCIFPPGDCSPNAKGSCVEIIQCDGPPPGPQCKCDGTVLENPDATCAPAGPRPNADLCQTGTFVCGDITCKRNLEVCVATNGGAMPTTTYACAALDEIDDTCVNGIPDCACMQPAECGGASCCTADADHQETITINAP
jgi:hypothetical protein